MSLFWNILKNKMDRYVIKYSKRECENFGGKYMGV